MNSVKDRLTQLRKWMEQAGCQACVVPQTDEHLSEYVEKHDALRTYFSGFSGSNGTLVVTLKNAGLWTDSRYFLQAERELAGSGIDLLKQGIAGTPSVVEFLLKSIGEDATLALNDKYFKTNAVEQLEQYFPLLKTNEFESIWEDRPPYPVHPCFLFPEKFTGKTAVAKIQELQKSMRQHECNFALLTSLEDIAWILNVRGHDIPHVPVVRSYLMIGLKASYWFVNAAQVPANVEKAMADLQIQLRPYDGLEEWLQEQMNAAQEEPIIWYDSNQTNAFLSARLQNCMSLDRPLPVGKAKSCKNPTELAGMDQAMLYDGVVWVRTLRFIQKAMQEATLNLSVLEESTKSKHPQLTELGLKRQIKEFKSQQPLFLDESFGTIVGYGEHGAVVHYAVNENTDVPLQPSSFVLIDSGTHYWCGTTDTTRTVACGPLTPEQKRDYTLVLKGMIALASAQFPPFTMGCQLDVLAKQYLWQQGLDFGHGTGHGVGHVLNVHEPFISVSPRALQYLMPGMCLSDEPGYYKSGAYGIRIENMLTVEERGNGFYGFRVLTWAPLEMQAIDFSLLSEQEKQWIASYHERLLNALQPYLSAEEFAWLKDYVHEK